MLSLKDFILKLIQGIVIGIGAVLPGISGGVLSVVFGVYQPIMEFLADPVSCFKTHFPVLFPVFLGYGTGFLGVANLLAFLLENNPALSICFFLGLIFGTVPSLFQQAREQGYETGSDCAFFLCMLITFLLLCLLITMSIQILQRRISGCWQNSAVSGCRSVCVVDINAFRCRDRNHLQPQSLTDISHMFTVCVSSLSTINNRLRQILTDV